ncbi:MAG: hypothetical protein HWQ38_08890 [Nostoc sp. NMS7]|uniref:hypothetical protein n=1 Tax=Nostoc sp. NMS7 TaxID=2815391 RepID=UPI0025D2ED5B|nr:hypothetical protein [Nostoc sp. NMS7]MBN3946597.1 hypothetical protein [Nostoc sp. NMS7]
MTLKDEAIIQLRPQLRTANCELRIVRSQFVPKLQEQYINLYIPKLATQLGGEVVATGSNGSVTTVRVLLPTQTIRR